MKKAILHLIVFTGICTLLYSCKKSEDHTTFSPTPSITASIAESDWVATSLNAAIAKSGDTSFLEIKGWEAASDRTIYMELINYKSAAGKYAVDSPGVQAIAYYKKGNVITWGKVGAITIYNVTPGLVQGTFDFSMKDNSKLIDIEVKGKFTVAPEQ